jgi:hypothetical protein
MKEIRGKHYQLNKERIYEKKKNIISRRKKTIYITLNLIIDDVILNFFSTIFIK